MKFRWDTDVDLRAAQAAAERLHARLAETAQTVEHAKKYASDAAEFCRQTELALRDALRAAEEERIARLNRAETVRAERGEAAADRCRETAAECQRVIGRLDGNLAAFLPLKAAVEGAAQSAYAAARAYADSAARALETTTIWLAQNRSAARRAEAYLRVPLPLL